MKDEGPPSLSIPETKIIPLNDENLWGKDNEFWQTLEKNYKTPTPEKEVSELAHKIKDYLNEKSDKLDILAFDESRKKVDERFIVASETFKSADIWILGDLHGDILALLTALHYIEKNKCAEKCITVFMGDIFDRGIFQADVLYKVLSLIFNGHGSYGFIVGNHDEGLSRLPSGEFTSSVQPCEFADWLNEQKADSPWRDLAEVAIAFFKYAPRAVLLPDGLLLAHGGVPHVDRHEMIKSFDDLNDLNISEDFVWTRMHERAPHKIPNRLTRGCSLGVEDFYAFCELLENKLNTVPIKGMIRGHDHLEERYRFFKKYQKRPVLTLNTICYRQEGEIFGDFDKPVIVAHCETETMPRVHQIEMPKELIESVYRPEVSKPDATACAS